MRRIVLAVLIAASAGGAHAQYYPYYAGNATQRSAPQPLPASVVPQRYYAPTYGNAAPVPVSAASTAAPVQNIAYAAPQPAMIAPPPPAAYIAPAPSYAPATPVAAVPQPAVANAAPIYANTAPAYTYAAAQPAPTYNYATNGYQPPASTSPFNSYAVAAPAQYRANRFYIGVHGYYDRYQEDSVDLENNGLYGGLDYGYTHYFTPNWFGGLQGRASYGQTDYKSISGEIARIPGYELDNRLLVGYDVNYASGTAKNRHFKPYLGLGVRYYSEGGKGEVTNSSPPAAGYDRRITQLYMPVGFNYDFTAWGYDMSPSFEVDPLLYGYVQSRFQNIAGGQQASNIQHSGGGLRMAWLVGKQDDAGRGWQAGPFVNYWDMNDSELADCNGPVAGVGKCLVEPDNTRLQAGVTARLMF